MNSIVRDLLVGLTMSVMALAFSPVIAVAQVFPPPGAPLLPPPPAPPPPPKIEVPVVPKMDSPPPFALQNSTPGLVQPHQPRQNLKPLHRRGSFSDRISRCLDEGAAMGLGPNERSEYSRSCANQ